MILVVVDEESTCWHLMTDGWTETDWVCLLCYLPVYYLDYAYSGAVSLDVVVCLRTSEGRNGRRIRGSFLFIHGRVCNYSFPTSDEVELDLPLCVFVNVRKTVFLPGLLTYWLQLGLGVNCKDRSGVLVVE